MSDVSDTLSPDGDIHDAIDLLLKRKLPGAPVVDKATMESSVEGVYVAGTAVSGTQRRTRVFIENAHHRTFCDVPQLDIAACRRKH